MTFFSVVTGFAVVVLSVGFLLLTIEGFYRLRSWFSKTFLIEEVTRSQYLSKEYQDYIKRVEDWSKPMFTYHPIGLRLFNLDNPIPGRVDNNSLGFRCREFTPPNPEVYRIILLGGSAAWGSGATSNETTISGYIESILSQRNNLPGNYKKVECYNLAQLNGHQTQDILSLTFYGEILKPNLVISFSGWNELISTETMSEELLDKYGLFYIEEMEGWEPIQVATNRSKLLSDAFSLWIREKSEFARQFISAGRQKKGVERPPIEKMIERRSRLFMNHLKILKRISNSFKSEHLQFLQPYLYRKRNLTEQEKKVIRLYDEIRPVHGGKTMGDFLRNNNIYEPMLDELTSKPDQYGIVYDLCDLFREKETTSFHTLVHMTDEGYKQTAKTIIDKL